MYMNRKVWPEERRKYKRRCESIFVRLELKWWNSEKTCVIYKYLSKAENQKPDPKLLNRLCGCGECECSECECQLMFTDKVKI